MEKYQKEVSKACKQYKHSKERIKFLKENMMRSELMFIGMTVVQIRKELKSGFSFSEKTLEEQKDIWEYLFKNAEYFEVMSMALIFFQNHKATLDLLDWKRLKSWSSKIENWEHSDRLSDLYSHLHEQYSKEIYPVFEKWNTSKQPWLRRLSIVSLFYYANSRKKYPSFPKVVRLVDNLLFDKHIYVQKGVGWALRELYNVYPDKTFVYLKKHAVDLAPASWQAATEKLTSKNKKILKNIRQKKYAKAV